MAEQSGATEQTAEQSRDFLANISTQIMLQNATLVGDSKEDREAQGELRAHARDQLTAIALQSGLIQDQTKTIEEGDEKLVAEAEKSNDWMSKAAEFADRQAKAALRQASKVKDIGKTQVDMLKGAAKGLFDLLLTGLGLFALWKLFEWLSEQDWEQIAKDVKTWVDDLVTKWEEWQGVIEDIGGFLLRMTGIFWVMTLFKRWKTVFGIGGAAYQLWEWMIKNPISALFGEDGALRKIIRIIRKAFGAAGMLAVAAGKVVLGKERFDTIFGKDGHLRTMLRNIRSMFGWMLFGAADDVGMRKGFWSTWFGKEGRIRTLLRNIAQMFGFLLDEADTDTKAKKGLWATLFGPDSKIRKILKWIKTIFMGGIITNTMTHFKEVKGIIPTLFGIDSPLRSILRWIKTIFGGSIRFLLNFATGGAFGLLFGEEGALRKLLAWVQGFFGGGAKGGGLKGAFDTIAKSKKLIAIKDFLGKIGSKFLKFLGPISWLIAGYQAIAGEGGFMDAFEKEEGSLWDKTVAGLSAAVTSLINFFIFDTVQLVEDLIKWVIVKIGALFGVDEETMKKQAWFNFSITGFLKDVFGDYMLYIEGLLTMDPKKMAAGIKGIWGKFSSLIDWAYGTLVAPLITWAAGLLGFEIDEKAVEKFKPMAWLEETIDPLIQWIKSLFDIDFEKLAKNLMPSALYDFLFGGKEAKMKKELYDMGGLVDDWGADSIDADKLKNLIEGKEGKDRRGLLGQLSSLVTDTDLEEAEREKLKALLNEYGAKLQEGGTIPAGKTVLGTLHGPEAVIPLDKRIPAVDRPAGGAGATSVVVAPSSITNNSSTPTSVVVGVSSKDPKKSTLGMN
tara:strand:- start:706 stop:3228 length:2523 start_codon:yes stop_codon:yes gene_type:complete